MTALRLRGPAAPDPTKDLITEAIRRAGPVRVLTAAIIALLRPRPRPPDLGSLPPHLGKDLGLEADLPPLPPSARLGSGALPHSPDSYLTLPGTGLR